MPQPELPKDWEAQFAQIMKPVVEEFEDSPVVWGIVMFRIDHMREIVASWDHLLEEHEDCEETCEFLDEVMENLVEHLREQLTNYEEITGDDDV